MIAKQPDILEALKTSEAYLLGRGVPNARRNAEWMLAHVLDCRSPDLYLDPHRLLEKRERDRFDALVRRRGAREPLQYILGSTEFMSLEFEVRPGVFVPRPDTEVLVERVEALLTGGGTLAGTAVLDLCCGTGVIIVSLLRRNPGMSGAAVDIDPAAVALTRKNAERNGVLNRLDCVNRDAVEWLENSVPAYGVITCNPPYVESGEMDRLPPEIARHEPRLSLDGGSDGLDFYRSVIPLASRALVPRGIVAFEIGDTQGGPVSALLGEAAFTRIQVHKDYNQLDRVVTAISP